MEYRIRPARPGEGARLSAVEDDAALRFEEVGLRAAIEMPAYSADDYERSIGSGRVLVAVVDDDTVVGLALCSEVDGCAHLLELDVARAFQGRGIGRALLAAAAEWGRRRGHSRMTLTTYRDVPWNGPFYRRHGFVDLDDASLGTGLAAIRSHEVEIGLDEAPRLAMELRLGTPAP